MTTVNIIPTVLFLVLGLICILFHGFISRRITNFHIKAQNFKMTERDIKNADIIVLVVGIGFFLFGILIALGVLSFPNNN